MESKAFILGKSNYYTEMLREKILKYSYRMKITLASVFVILVLCVLLALSIHMMYGRFQRYFFIGDPDFDLPLSRSRWRDTIWNPQSGSYVTVSNGICELYYSETRGENWGASILFQGRYPHNGIQWLPLIVGDSEQTAKDEDFCSFSGHVPKGKFLLETRFKVVQRTFQHDVGFDDPKGNIGLDLMCSINDLDYDQESRSCVHIGIIFGGFVWNGDVFEDAAEGTEWVERNAIYDPDIHVSLFVHKVSALSTWQTVVLDLGEIINRVFVLLQTDNIHKLNVYGLQLYVEGVGVDVKAQFDYIRTKV